MPHTDLRVSVTQANATSLTPAQKRFNTLLRQIEQARQTLRAWGDNVATFRKAHAEVLLPLQDEVATARRQWVFAAEALLNDRRWTKAERALLRELVCDIAHDLLTEDEDDQPLQAIFARHAGTDFDTERREQVLAMKEMAEAITGMDLGDEADLNTDDDLLDRLQREMRANAEAVNARAHSKRPKRKSAAALRRESETQQATQSMREIFRKLASALHPDRESDAVKREEKTALMQRVNQAYATRDLLALLELQLQIEQIDANHIAQASNQRLQHYNKVLGEQLADLKTEIDRSKMSFCVEFDMHPAQPLNPLKLGSLLEQGRRELRAALSQEQRDLQVLGDIAAAKRWLKQQKRFRDEEQFDFMPF